MFNALPKRSGFALRSPSATAMGLAVALLLACTGPRDSSDLTITTPIELDLTSESNRAILLEGWTLDERTEQDRRVLWGSPHGARVLLPTPGDGPLRVLVRGRLENRDLTAQCSALSNATELGSQALVGAGELEFAIEPAAPATAVTLRCETAGEPLPVAWQALRVEPVDGQQASVQLGLRELPDPNAASETQRTIPSVLSRGSGPARRQPLTPCRGKERARNLVVYLVDTLRRDRLGTYGNARGLTPNFDALSRRAIVLDRAVAESPWTRPSVTSLLTGLSPVVHGVVTRDSVLVEEFSTLAEIFGAFGFRTAGFTTNPNVGGRYGLRQGFEVYRLLSRFRDSATHVNRRGLNWLSTLGADEPFVLLLHTIEPHSPYAPSERFRLEFAADVSNPGSYGFRAMRQLGSLDAEASARARTDLELLYDASVAENDDAFGELVAQLEARGLLDQTAIVVISDHGEEFYEHGHWEHGKSLHTEVLDVPAILSLPGCDHQRWPYAASLADVLPTLLDYFGLEASTRFDGESLFCATCWPRALLSHTGVEVFQGVSLTSDTLRMITPDRPEAGGGTRLYDHLLDPFEQRSAATDHPAALLFLARRLAALPAVSASAETLDASELDKDTVQRLRALGYIE